MAAILGIDTGGTYTDGVLINPKTRVVCAKAKAFTTRENLAEGIAACMARLPQTLLRESVMVCLSTTLATNAVVEGRSGRVGVFLMGRSLDRPLPAARIARLRGELDIKGRQLTALDEDEICRKALEMQGEVDAAAISGFASVRDPSHENRVKELVRQTLGVPVVCAHELSQQLGFYDRTVTAVLNAGLIPSIAALIYAVETVLAAYGLQHAPVMIVRGDGSLMRRDYALDRPIETVLSGPAASIVGGRYLTGEEDALVLDMGGTTTDIALIRGGRASISKVGATVGGWRTQLRAADIYTYGVGGDSRLAFDPQGRLAVGPLRVVPLCVAGVHAPWLAEELRQSIGRTMTELGGEQYAECYRLTGRQSGGLAAKEQALLHLLAKGAHSLFWLADQTGCDAAKLGLEKLVQMGLLQRCGLTPTDLLHAAGRFGRWNAEAAAAGVAVMAARAGKTEKTFLQQALGAVERNVGLACLRTALGLSGCGTQADTIASYLWDSAEKGGVDPLLGLQLSVNRPVIALGAPVAAWLPKVCKALNARLLIPEHAEVANAVGAAAGNVSVEVTALIRPDQYHEKLVVHAPWGLAAFDTLDGAQRFAEERAAQAAREQAEAAGSRAVELTQTVHPVYAERPGTAEKTFIEMRLRVVAVGAPAWNENTV